MKTTRAFVAATAMLASLAACGQPPAPEAGGAQAASSEMISENTYRIATHGVTVTAPDGWYVADNALMSEIMDAGRDMTTANMDATTRAAVDSAAGRGSTLFTFMEEAPSAPREYIPAALGVAENVSMLPGVKRGSDYFFHARQLMAQSAIPITMSDTYGERMIDGHSFDRLDLEMGADGAKVRQRHYAARHGDSVVVFIQSYRTDEELALLDTVIDSIKLDW